MGGRRDDLRPDAAAWLGRLLSRPSAQPLHADLRLTARGLRLSSRCVTMASAADDPVHVMHGARIGRYAILERIGRGAIGVVYRARDEVMHREVAVKLLNSGLEDNLDVRARFRQEAETAAHLSHPNIITVYDVGEEGGRFYIVMELLRGSTLEGYLTLPDAAPLDRRLDLMIQLCAGLGAAHQASICHRDIKPGNVFVRTDGLLKILDFGIARLAGAGSSRAGTIVGTPDYMAPEQVRGAELDHRSDIFAAGGVFYFMLTGRKPFPASDLPTLFHEIQRVDPQPLDSDVPPELAAVVMKALAKDRAARYQTCGDLAADLLRVRRDHARDVARPQPSAPADDGRIGGRSIWTATTDDLAGTGGDTAELPPLACPRSDDTATITPGQPWTARVGTSIDRVLGGVVARWRDRSVRTRGRRASNPKG